MTALSRDEKQLICNITRKYATDQPYKVLVFGSRATNTNKKYSDIDLAFIAKQPMPIRTLSNLAEAFDESMLPYTVDIVDFNSADERLQQQIKQHGEELVST